MKYVVWLTLTLTLLTDFASTAETSKNKDVSNLLRKLGEKTKANGHPLKDLFRQGIPRQTDVGKYIDILLSQVFRDGLNPDAAAELKADLMELDYLLRDEGNSDIDLQDFLEHEVNPQTDLGNSAD